MSTPDLISTSFSLSGAADKTFYVCHGQAGEWKLQGVSIVASDDVTGGSHKFTLAVTQGSDTVCTTYATATDALTAGTVAALTMTATAGDAAEFGATDSVKFVYDQTGTTTFDVHVVCKWQKARV
jgi:hypothetical protein